MDMDHSPSSTPSATPGPSTGPNSYTVLRIKRKRTDAPLSSLFFQDPMQGKRRRNIAGRARGVFRLADTVPRDWVGAGQEGEVLKTRIQGLLSADSPTSSPSLSAPMPAPVAAPAPLHPGLQSPPREDVPHYVPSPVVSAHPDGQTSQPELVTESPHLVSSPAQTPASPAAQPAITSPPPQLPRGQAAQQYRVVPPVSPRTRSMLPPRVRTVADDEAAASSFVFVDAQAIESPETSAARAQEDKEMAAFLPMLEEYLQLEKEAATKQAAKEEDEWVYDLYYRDNRPGSLPLDMGAGDGVTIGQLLGFEDYSPPSSISGSEPEDEADEDSNDEDYYRNDYPEDEDADEDMQGFHGGGGEDSDWSEEYEEEEGDERGEWGYR